MQPRCALPSPPASTEWSRLLLHDVICSQRVTMHFQWEEICPWWPWPLTFDLDIHTPAVLRARDQTRLPCEFGANPLRGSRDISYTNKQTKKSQTAQKNRTLRSSLRAVKCVEYNGVTRWAGTTPGQFSVVANRPSSLDVKPEVPKRLAGGADKERLERLNGSERRQASCWRCLRRSTSSVSTNAWKHAVVFVVVASTVHTHSTLLWPPYGIGQAVIFLPCGFFYLSIFYLFFLA